MSRKILDRVIKQLRADQGTIRGGWTFEFPNLPRINIPDIGPGARSGSSSSSGQSMKMSAGPDGVRVETEEIDENGTKKRKVYEAENMEAFQKKHPGVLKSLDPGIRVHSVFEFSKNFPGGIFQGPKTLRTRVLRKDGERQRIEVETDTDRDHKDAQRQPPTEGKKLGFYVGELAPSVREYLGLDDGLGLLVDRIAAGTLAEKLKLKAGDIVVQLGKAKIYSTDDVRRGLEAIQNDEDVSVKVIRRGQHIVLRLGHEVPADKVERKLRPIKKR